VEHKRAKEPESVVAVLETASVRGETACAPLKVVPARGRPAQTRLAKDFACYLRVGQGDCDCGASGKEEVDYC